MADITRGVRSFTLGTAISRITGLFREIIFAYLYGASTSTDAFQASFRLLDLLRDLFAETTLSSAIIPVLTEEKSKGKVNQNLLASNIFNLLFFAVGIITILFIILAPYLVRVIAFGFGSIPGKYELTLQLARIILPFLLFVAFAAWSMSYLNTENRFFVPAVAPAWFNIFSIIVPLILYKHLTNRGIDPIFGMAYGVLVGGLVQFASQIPALIKNGFHYYLYLNLKDPPLRGIIFLFIPVVVGLASSRINVMVDTFMVSFLEEKSMTWLHYAFRIMHLPMGLFGIAVGAVALPSLSKLVVEKRIDELRSTLINSLHLVFLLTIFSSVLIIFFSHPITRIIYERGKFTAYDTSATASALIFYIIGVPFASGLRNVASAFYALKDSRTPMYVSLGMIAINVCLNYFLMKLMSFRGIALATSISAFLNFAILFNLLQKRVGNLWLKELTQFIFLTLIGATVSSLAGIMSFNYLLQIWKPVLLVQIFILFLSFGFVLILFYFFCKILNIKEALKILKQLFRR
ncbi:MAG: murein biosynthesis integral membrane protein MurJ [candidate division WOR-3 bacterium]|nr:murein biosynthesis integral membrane protein MurJ [candidate division WOR-3 bacterium]